MNELRDMKSKTNSLEGVKEKFKSVIIDNYKKALDELRNKETIWSTDIEEAKHHFRFAQEQDGADFSLRNNGSWSIVSRKNFFGLEAEIFPDYEKEFEKGNKLFLRANAGRFESSKFAGTDIFFPNSINISKIHKRNEEEQYKEVEEFYDMNNREVFEKYGIKTRNSKEMCLVANCVILDSLLKNKYSELEDVFCWTPVGYAIQIRLQDGTVIKANTDNKAIVAGKKGITIEKDGKEARVDFDAISMGEELDILTNINDLEVENVVYTGDEELIKQLKQAMQEQFKSQQQLVENEEKNVEEVSELQENKTESIEEKTGAQKIIEFMKQNNLEPQDLALALTMTLAKTTDKENAERHIINTVDKDKQISEDIRDNNH